MDEAARRFNALKRIHNSTNEAVERLQKENQRLNTAIQILLQEKKIWAESADKQQGIIQRTMDGFNEKNRLISEEMQGLREENRKLRDELKRCKEGV